MMDSILQNFKNSIRKQEVEEPNVKKEEYDTLSFSILDGLQKRFEQELYDESFAFNESRSLQDSLNLIEEVKGIGAEALAIAASPSLPLDLNLLEQLLIERRVKEAQRIAIKREIREEEEKELFLKSLKKLRDTINKGTLDEAVDLLVNLENDNEGNIEKRQLVLSERQAIISILQPGLSQVIEVKNYGTDGLEIAFNLNVTLNSSSYSSSNLRKWNLKLGEPDLLIAQLMDYIFGYVFPLMENVLSSQHPVTLQAVEQMNTFSILVKNQTLQSASFNLINFFLSLGRFMSVNLKDLGIPFQVLFTVPLWDKICHTIIEYHLNRSIPSAMKEIPLYQESAHLEVLRFEKGMEAFGFPVAIPSPLLTFINDIFQRAKALESAQVIERVAETITAPDIDSVVVGSIQYNVSYFSFPLCHIGKNVFKLIKLVSELLEDPSQAASSAELLRDILDLYRARIIVTLENKEKALTPYLIMILHNNCQYVAYNCHVWNYKVKRISSEKSHSVIDLVSQYQILGKYVYSLALDEQKRELDEILNSADGFDVDRPGRDKKVQKCVDQINFHLKRLSSVWKVILPLHVHFIALGQLMDFVLDRITLEIYQLPDISELESHSLCEILKFDKIDSLFITTEGDGEAGKEVHSSSSLIGHYSLRYAGFKTLIQLLTWSFAQIMDHFRMGALVDFEIDVLTSLVQALFSDTPLRQKNVEELRRGHPS